MIRTFTIPVLSDQLLESQEKFRLALTLAAGAPAGATLGALTQAEIAIDNDDSRKPHATLELPTPAPGDPPRLRVSGTPGQKYVLESSSDLTHWADLQTGTLQQAPSSIEPTGSAQVQFYRLRLIP